MLLSNEYFLKSLLFKSNLTEKSVAIVVTHLVADVNNFLKIINLTFEDLIIIPKKSSKTSESLKKYSPYGYVYEISRDQLVNDPLGVLTKLEGVICGRRFVIFDMGGYFSSLVGLLSTRNGQVLGIVEDTENGHIRYVNELLSNKECTFPIISVARSSLKEPEDVLVGQAISFSIEKILRSNQMILVNKSILILGYGKIGAGICQAMRGRGANVYFYDVDPIRTVKALAFGYRTGSRKKLISESDLIISATGNKALSKRDLADVKDGVYIFTATSLDDEFNNCLLNHLNSQMKKIESRDLSINYGCKKIKIGNRGNPVNFIDGAVLDRYIELVQAEMLLASSLLHTSLVGDVVEIDDDDKRFIAESWLDFYSRIQ
jgi:adenosylhomocysteinase